MATPPENPRLHCYRCMKPGHVSANCPHFDDTDSLRSLLGMFARTENSREPRCWRCLGRGHRSSICEDVATRVEDQVVRAYTRALTTPPTTPVAEPPSTTATTNSTTPTPNLGHHYAPLLVGKPAAEQSYAIYMLARHPRVVASFLMLTYGLFLFVCLVAAQLEGIMLMLVLSRLRE